MQLFERQGKRIGGWIGKGILYLLLILGGISMVLPLFWMAASSLKTPKQFFAWPPIWIPNPATLDAYHSVLTVIPFWHFFANSVFVSVAITSGQLFICALTGYTFAKFAFPGRNILFGLILSSMMVPFAVTLIPSFLLMSKFGWIDSYQALVIPHLASAFGVFLLRQFFKTVPDDYIDAARIDGASEFTIFYKIMLPLCKPALATLGIFVFLGSWNDMLWPLVMVNSDKYKTLPVAFATFSGLYQQHFDWVMAASTLFVVPVIIIFILFQDLFIRGIALTGLKG
jgi:multiple sugar transport system permease protein